MKSIQDLAKEYAATGWKQLETKEPDYDEEKYKAFLAGFVAHEFMSQNLLMEVATHFALWMKENYSYVDGEVWEGKDGNTYTTQDRYEYFLINQ